MPTIRVNVDSANYASLVKQRRIDGLPSVSALLLKRAGVLDDNSEADEIVRQAMDRAKKLPRGEEFRMRDLFKQDIWKKFPVGARLRAGKRFFAKVASAVDGIRALGKTSSGQQIYKRM
jgi:hypothetical protein